jgi:hypothetical protein
VRDDRSAIAVRVGDHCRLEQCQVGVVASVEWQFLDRARLDQVTEVAGSRVHGGKRRVQDDARFEADVGRQIDDRRLADG